jgi:dihydropteroate synthase
LAERGLDPVRADAAAQGLEPLVLVIDALPAEARETVAQAARDHGLECLTGEGWALLAGGAARFAGFIRPGFTSLPEELAEDIGRVVRGVLEGRSEWEMARGTVSLEQPVVVGILNVTPDSFSDGGQFLKPEHALHRAEQMLDDGAAIIDIGAESTRPGRPRPVSAEEEWSRLEPVLIELARRFPLVPLTVDTVKAETARRALEAGAWAINDVSGLRLDAMVADVCAEQGAGLILMHSRGGVTEMAGYDHASYDDLFGEVMQELQQSVSEAMARGVTRQVVLLNRLPAMASWGFPIMVGPSRKRFLGEVAGADTADRDAATAAVCVAAYVLGASFFRVHAVDQVGAALRMAHAVRSV